MNKTIDVCLSPELSHQYAIQDSIVVVVDILRATSCMVSGIAHGIDHIIPFADKEACLAMRSEGYTIAGERNGEKIEGFDIGNSPFSYAEASMKGKKVAVTTTNGTLAIEKAKEARQVIIGSFLNLQAVADYLKTQEYPVLILCAGWKGRVNLEDSLFAGALVHHLRDEYTYACDVPIAVEAMYAQADSDLIGFMINSSHVQRLKRLNIGKDIEQCLTLDLYDAIPVLEKGRLVKMAL